MTSKQVKSSKKITVGLILNWIFGILFALTGFIFVFSEPIPGLVMLVMAAILLPPVVKLIRQKGNFKLTKGIKAGVIIIGLIIFGATIDTSNVSTTQQNEPQKEEEQATQNEDVEKETVTTEQVKSDDNIIQKVNQEKPSWYNKELIIDSSEFEFMSSKEVNIWPSYNDRSKVLGKVSQKDKVSIIGYDSNNDYCKIKKDEVKGWIACAWINNLPNDITDSWEIK